MNEATDLLLLSVAATAKEGAYFDIYQAIGRMTLQVVGTTAFGYAATHSLSFLAWLQMSILRHQLSYRTVDMCTILEPAHRS